MMANEETADRTEVSEHKSVKNINKLERTANANWQGNLKDGKGTISLQSGILENANYSFRTRFEEGLKGTNPEELLGGALVGCFTMAVSAILTKNGFKPESLETKAKVKLEGLSIVSIHLAILGIVPDLTLEEFSDATKDAEKNCIISKTLCIPITSEAQLGNLEKNNLSSNQS